MLQRNIIEVLECPDCCGRLRFVAADEVTVDFRAEDDVMLASGYGLLLFHTDDDKHLAVLGSSPGAIGVKTFAGTTTLPLLAVTVGPAGADPTSDVVGFLARVEGKYSVPVVARAGAREERGSLILSDDGVVDGLYGSPWTPKWANTRATKASRPRCRKSA